MQIQALVDRCLKGDRRAQKELYGQYARGMYNVCRRMLGNEEDARDVLQDAFCKCFQKMDTFKGESTFGAWLKRIVVNHCLNFIQRDKSRMWTELKELPEEADDRPVFDDGWEKKADMRRILDAVDKISKGCKVVFNLYMFEGYDHKEIGEILGISESASKAQLSKAKSKIRKVLETQNIRKVS